MIKPSKHIRINNTLLGLGAVIIKELNRQHTVSALWSKVKDEPSVGTYERFILALDMLFITGAIEYDGIMLSKGER